jgi:hypothetical protein
MQNWQIGALCLLGLIMLVAFVWNKINNKKSDQTVVQSTTKDDANLVENAILVLKRNGAKPETLSSATVETFQWRITQNPSLDTQTDTPKATVKALLSKLNSAINNSITE